LQFCFFLLSISYKNKRQAFSGLFKQQKSTGNQRAVKWEGTAAGRLCLRQQCQDPRPKETNPRLGVSGAGQKQMVNHPNRNRFREGQEVEVEEITWPEKARKAVILWHKAKITGAPQRRIIQCSIGAPSNVYPVELLDGRKGEFTTKQIRTAKKRVPPAG
jgi:hypothetical protein